jgi:prepilin-type N-terminal cleavage/methylation domain-containing protein
VVGEGCLGGWSGNVAGFQKRARPSAVERGQSWDKARCRRAYVRWPRLKVRWRRLTVRWRRLKVRCRRLEVRCRRLEVRCRRLNVRCRRLNVRCRRLNVRCRRLEVRCRRLNVRCRRLNVRCRRLEVRCRRLKVRWRRLKVRCRRLKVRCRCAVIVTGITQQHAQSSVSLSLVAPFARRCGFTLLELVVVIAILGVTFAVAIPSLTNRSRYDESDVAGSITRLLERARNTAAEQARATRVTIAPSTARAWFRIGDSDTALDSAITLALPSGTTLSATTPRVEFIFEPSGRARGDQLLIDANGARTSISVDPSSGDIRRSSNASP